MVGLRLLGRAGVCVGAGIAVRAGQLLVRQGSCTEVVCALVSGLCCCRFSHPNIQVVRNWAEVEAAVAALAAQVQTV